MQAHDASAPMPRSLAARSLWFVCGISCVALGVVGVILPGLPTTVFFIGAAASFSRSSPRLEAWVLGLPVVGRAVSDYRAGLGIPKRAKILAVAMLVIAITLSVLLLDWWLIRLIVVAAGAIGVTVILRVPTRY
ncbi:MAG: YbaN family protein [Actinomycetota bacterium]|jgi:uncharacterized protein|nr:YbaN family protein [Actinomycetota bacterium]